jgi:hypothetical protein
MDDKKSIAVQGRSGAFRAPRVRGCRLRAAGRGGQSISGKTRMMTSSEALRGATAAFQGTIGGRAAAIHGTIGGRAAAIHGTISALRHKRPLRGF